MVVRAVSVAFLVGIHLAPLSSIKYGVDGRSLALCLVLYLIRMFALSAGYHRYFAHRAFRTSRWFQFALALVAASAGQKGPLWWAGVHRQHHRFADGPRDVHSPRLQGIFHAHIGWLLAPSNGAVPFDVIRDFARFPELRLLDRFHYLAPTALGLGCYFLGGPRAFFAGFCLSTVLSYHGIFVIGSLSHLPGFGTRRFDTRDHSCNHWLVALLTMGEGWHNNHHYHSSSARQGFYWWEIDLAYYGLKLLALVGAVRDLRSPPGMVHSNTTVLLP